MLKRWVKIAAMVLILLVSAATGGLAEVKVLVIPKGTEAVFWKNVAAGAKKAGDELGIHVTYRGPLSAVQHDAQIQIIEYGIRGGYHAIVLAPNHVTLPAPALERAVAAGMKVVLIDSNMDSHHHACFVESDNYRAGQVAADYAASLVGGAGRVALVRYLKNHASTLERERGFLDAIATRYPQMEVIADPHAGPSIGTAFRIVSDLIDRFSPIDAIFTDAESTTLGVLRALREKHPRGKVKFIGFDFNATIRAAILNREITATIIQNPFQMGYRGVTAAYDLVQGKAVAEKIYTDTILVTADNYHTEAVQKILRSNTPVAD
mgnify:CR=1 FL=1